MSICLTEGSTLAWAQSNDSRVNGKKQSPCYANVMLFQNINILVNLELKISYTKILTSLHTPKKYYICL